MNRTLSNPIVLLFVTIVLLIVVGSTFSIIPETKQAVVVRFGQPERILNRYRPNEQFGASGAGLAARVPFVDGIVWIDKRIQSIDMENQQVLSADQLRLQVDAFARYRIVDPLRMYISARTEDNVTAQLQPILASALRNELGRSPFASLLSPERSQMMDNIQNALNRVARQYGAEIVDVGEVLERPDATRCRTGADGDEEFRLLAHHLDALSVVRSSDRALDQRQIVGSLDERARRLGKVGDLDRGAERQQLVLAIEQRELAAVTGGELPDCKTWA